ncbi:non-ribosomal peptide synthetase [Amycolatopsis sp. lyj-346]|uniref:non-ribosomal peptide synthetase n=1 Tax=Amycolatopsis sp. lyj-346 TaxID=2789289 RepID=UPI00397E9133
MSPDIATGTLHALFEARVRDTPDAIALHYLDRRIKYGDLNRRANRLAHYLRLKCRVGPDDRVAILVRDPPSVVVAIIATLKAGGGYVPLDPDNPPQVTQQILDDARPTTLLLESSCAAGAALFAGELFVMDVQDADLDTPGTDPEPAARDADLAYVIYTSGTTGRPKGVAVEHRAILNTIRWRTAYYRFSGSDLTLAIPRPSFDSAVEDLFCALSAGAGLLLPERERVTDRRYLGELIEKQAVTHFLITPALHKRLLGGIGDDTALRSVTIAGEAFSQDLVDYHYRRLPGVALYNEYGPSENAVCSTVHSLRAGEAAVLLGKPIDNTFAFVRKEDGSVARIGEIGELYLGGAGLARGYVGDPALTAARFLTAPDPDGVPRRVYRSGDLVRVHADGGLQFVGRTDRQVKIRGKRVELDHVAQALARDPSVDDVHVLLRSDPPQLLAFVTGSVPDVARLRENARETLPSHMVPHAVVEVAEIPLTGNGKVDEQALNAAYERLSGGSEPVTMSAAERSLLKIWHDLLPRAAIGLDEDFFVLGGDSLTVMDLVAEVEDALGVRMDNADAYTHRTIRTFARLAECRRAATLETR